MSSPLVSIVIIGRNEGERLARCLDSVHNMDFPQQQLQVIYVDSGSRDDSLARAQQMGAEAVAVPPGPTTAARGRNTGLALAQAPYVFFIDGDTIVDPAFLTTALQYLQEHQQVAGVCGNRREIAPHASIYNRIQDMEWNGAVGPIPFFGGDTLVRKAVLDAVGPYNPHLVAGEEPELCHRIRRAGFQVIHLDIPMTLHDMALYHFPGYWRRCFRTGYAYAEVAGMTSGETWGAESKRNLVQGAIYLFGPLLLLLLLRLWALPLILLGAFALWARTLWKGRDRKSSPGAALLYALHAHLCQVPIFLGQVRFLRDRRNKVPGKLIEYK